MTKYNQLIVVTLAALAARQPNLSREGGGGVIWGVVCRCALLMMTIRIVQTLFCSLVGWVGIRKKRDMH